MLITEKYSAGNIAHAINSYWSPLISWLSAPFHLIGFNAMDAIRLLNFMVGIMVLRKCAVIFKHLGFNASIIIALQILLTPCLAYMAVVFLVPDLLSAWLVLWFFERLVFKHETRIWKLTLIIGLAYFAKSYNLVALSVFVVFYVVFFERNNTLFNRVKHIAKIGALTFLFILPWILALYLKYDYVTLSDSARYNHGINNPQSPGHVFYNSGIKAPPTGVDNCWEQPALLKTHAWSFFESKQTYEHTWYLLTKNFNFSVQASFNGSALFYLFMLVLFFIAVFRKNRIAVLSFLFIGLYSVTYFFIVYEDRYVWPCYFIFLIGFAALIKQRDHYLGIAALFVFLGMFSVYKFIAEVRLEKSQDIIYANYLKMADCIKENIPAAKKIASDKFNWNEGLYVSYYLKARFFNASTNSNNLEHGIARYNIDAFIGVNDTTYHKFAAPVCYFDKGNIVIWKVK